MLLKGYGNFSITSGAKYFQSTRARRDSFEVDIQVSYIVFCYSGEIKAS